MHSGASFGEPRVACDLLMGHIIRRSRRKWPRSRIVREVSRGPVECGRGAVEVCAQAQSQPWTYEEAVRRPGLDRRTVRAIVKR
jgi:hypothetical protein